MNIKIPKTIGGVPVEGAMDRALKREEANVQTPPQEVQELLDRLDRLEKAIRDGKSPFVSVPVRTIILVCLGLGIVCVLSTAMKSWFGQPNQLDWGVLFVGLVLCAISLFKEFTIGKQGISATLKSVQDILQSTRSVIHNLTIRK